MPGGARSVVRSIAVLTLVAGAWLTAVPSASASTLTVNTTEDTNDGHCDLSPDCSLRDAITVANATAASDVIHFSLSSATPVIAVGSSGNGALPAITHPVVIDGTSGASTRIELEGSQAGQDMNGLVVSGGDSTIKGLVIDGFDGDGIKLDTAGGDVVVNCRIGTNAAGTAAAGNVRHGIEINGAFDHGIGGNVIGGTTVAARNVISGNGLLGVFVIGSNGNVIDGNRIGTNAAGTAALPNSVHGIEILGAKSNLIGGTVAGAGNLVSGNGQSGIVFEDDFNFTSTSGNVAQGNLIGTNAAGTAALGNAQDGITFSDFPEHTLIGGTTPAARNVISGNGRDGINVSVNQVTAHETITGNYIGTDVTGSVAIPNHQDGIDLDAARSDVIGGTAPGAGNVISGNTRDGIRIENTFGPPEEARANVVRGNLIGTNAAGTAALGNLVGIHDINQPELTVGGTASGAGNLVSGNALGIQLVGSDSVVQGNKVGTDAAGTGAIPNESDGVVVNGAQDLIGGTVRGAGNVIAFNGPSIVGGNGVLVKSAAAVTIEGNSIFSNSILGIDLGDDGVTANDPGDADAGDNDLQNFPSISSAKSNSTTTHVTGKLSSEPNVLFTVELFSSPACDDSGNGQGQRFLGRTDVTTNGAGTGTFDVTFRVQTPLGNRVTGTATNPGGATSEFSVCRKVVSGS
jgi:CSLREA domain-containing protein